jgi:outer membrane receptor protein involved in Fe transport
VVLPEVTVSATRTERDSMDLPVSIDSIDQRTIREANPQVNLSEVLGRVPGIAVQNRQNYAQDLQISSRGFGARAAFGVRGIRLIADGIPATMPDGQGQAASFNLSSAQRIEVMRGPFSSLYGNAAGGVVQVFTADGVEIGQFGAERRQFLPIDQIPLRLQQAVLAVEDARFYSHSGLDLVGVARAVLAQFTGGQASAYIQDAWEVTPRLTVNMGVRADAPFFNNTPVNQPRVDSAKGIVSTPLLLPAQALEKLVRATKPTAPVD